VTKGLHIKVGKVDLLAFLPPLACQLMSVLVHGANKIAVQGVQVLDLFRQILPNLERYLSTCGHSQLLGLVLSLLVVTFHS
jgi:hypothetical protein